jgi:hypothetical protein
MKNRLVKCKWHLKLIEQWGTLRHVAICSITAWSWAARVDNEKVGFKQAVMEVERKKQR